MPSKTDVMWGVTGSRGTKYVVGGDMDSLLGELSYEGAGEVQSEGWRVLVAERDGAQEFAAVYGSGELFVNGPYDNPSDVGNDLETMVGVYNEGWLSKGVRNRNPLLALVGGIPAVPALIMYMASPAFTVGAVTSLFCVASVGMLFAMGVAAFGSDIMNWWDGRKLSDGAARYLVGKDAEERLRDLREHQRLSSGEVSIEDYLKVRGHEEALKEIAKDTAVYNGMVSGAVGATEYRKSLGYEW